MKLEKQDLNNNLVPRPIRRYADAHAMLIQSSNHLVMRMHPVIVSLDSEYVRSHNYPRPRPLQPALAFFSHVVASAASFSHC